MAILDSAEKEQKLIIDAIRSDENSEMLETLFRHIGESSEHFFEDEYRQDLLSYNESNIRNIIRIIKENRLDEEWRNEKIFANTFAEICAIPIFLPVTFMGMLSGEFIIYLLHGDQIQIYCQNKNTLKKEEDESDEAYNERTKNNIYSKRYNRFYEGKSSYVKQLQETFSVDISPLLKGKTTHYGRKFKKRSATKLEELFDMYSYLQKGKIFKDNNRAKVFSAFSKEYVDMFPMRIDGELNANQKNILLLKTFLFQKLDRESRAESSLYVEIKKSIITLGKIVNDIRYALFYMEYLIKISDTEQSKQYESGLAFSIKMLQKMCNDQRSQMDYCIASENKSKCRMVSNEGELYPKLLAIIIMYEYLRDLEIKEKAFRVKFNEKTSLKDTEFYLDLHKPGLSVDCNWDYFFPSQKYLLEQLLGKKEADQYKKIWLIALKVLMYCYPERTNFDCSMGDVPRTLDERWFKRNNISFGRIKPIELYSMMKLVDRSEKEHVITEGNNSKTYRMLADKESIFSTKTTNPSTLRTMFDNIRKQNCQELRTHVMRLLVEQNDVWIGQGRSIDCVRNICSAIIYGFRCVAQHTSSLPDAISGVSKLVEYWNKTAINMYAEMKLEYQQRLSWMATMNHLVHHEK